MKVLNLIRWDDFWDDMECSFCKCRFGYGNDTYMHKRLDGYEIMINHMKKEHPVEKSKIRDLERKYAELVANKI